MPSCAIKWCGKCTNTSSYTKDGITFHRFPNDDIDMKEIWIKATHRDNFIPTKFSVICSRHFTPDCFESLQNNRRRLYRSSVPSLYLPALEPSPYLNDTQAHLYSSEDIDNTSSISQSSDEQNFKNPEEQYTDFTPRELNMKRNIDQLIYSLNKKKKDVKRLQDKTRKLKKKVASLQEFIDTLTKK